MQVGFGEICLAQICSPEVGVAEICSRKIGPLECSLTQVDLGECSDPAVAEISLGSLLLLGLPPLAM
jgi:hypothetical protein